MAERGSPTLFHCPACDAQYKVVRVEAKPGEITEDSVECRNCAGLLPARDGDFMLKYFLVGPTKRARRKK